MPLGVLIPETIWHRFYPRAATLLVPANKGLKAQQRRCYICACSTGICYPVSIAKPRETSKPQRHCHTTAQASRLSSSNDQDHAQKLDQSRGYTLLQRQAQRGKYHEVQETVRCLVREQRNKPDLRIYEALILANSDTSYGSASEVARLLEDMTKKGITPGSEILHSTLRVLAVHPDYLLRNQVLDELRKRWFSLTSHGWHDLIVGLIREHQLELALDALETMQKDRINIQPWLYDMFVYTLCSAGEFDEAVRLLEYRLENEESPVSPTLWSYVLDSASRASHLPLTLLAFNIRVEPGYLNPSSGVCTNILSTAARHGDARLATDVIRILSRRSSNPLQLHHYESLLETYVAGNDLRTALVLLTTMGAAGYPPTEASTRCIYTHLRQSCNMPKTTHEYLYSLRSEGRTIPIQIINVLIESYVYHEKLELAMELYKSMQALSSYLRPNAATFNALLRGCALYKDKASTTSLAQDMEALAVLPSSLTFDRLLLVCLTCDAGMEDAWVQLDKMRAAGWWPRPGTAKLVLMKACKLADMKVWNLVHRTEETELSVRSVESVVRDHWPGGEDAVNAEIERARSVARCQTIRC